jgi:ElaB/YqjD/DUF883 family membrane-anchored ribosome-binding protein
MASNPATSSNQQKEQIDRLSDRAHGAVERATSAATSFADNLGERADQLMEMKDDWIEGASDYVREHPVAALGMALAAGYLLSIIMRSRD